MGILEELAQGIEGFSQGVPQGMDIYARYSELQEQNRQRARQQQLEQFFMDKTKEGPISDKGQLMLDASDYATGIGAIDQAMQYYQAGTQLKAAEKTKDVQRAFASVMGGDPNSITQSLNDVASKYGIGTTYDIRTGPQGLEFVTVGPDGQENVQPMTDMEELQATALGTLEPLVADDLGEYVTNQAKRKQATEEGALAKAKTRAAELEAGLTEKFGEQQIKAELAQRQASTEASQASAESSRASAQKSRADLAREEAEAPAQREYLEARTHYLRSQGEGTIESKVDTMLGDQPEPLPGQVQPPNQDQFLLTTTAKDLKNANQLDDNTAIAVANAMLSSPAAYNRRTGEVVFNGQTYKMSSAAMQNVMQATSRLNAAISEQSK